MPDPITMFHPGVPNSTSWVERVTYREHWYPRGWRSNDDPYTELSHLTPGSEIDSGDIQTDGSTFTATIVEIVPTAARLTLPTIGQPVLLQAWFQLASVTSVSTFTVGFAKLAEINGLGLKGARQFPSVPINGTAGVGIDVHLAYRVPADTTATDWTVIGGRDSGAGSGQLKANGLYHGLTLARAL